MEKILEKYFRDKKVAYFMQDDSFTGLYGESYLRYEFFGNMKNQVLISIGNNEGEVPIRVCTNPEKLEALMQSIIY